jgi:hypothetical protein
MDDGDALPVRRADDAIARLEDETADALHAIIVPRPSRERAT